MSVDLRQNYFELFGLPVAFDVEPERLALAWRELQRATHPDRYAAGSAQERRLAVQQAALVNEAYAALREPLPRAKYLLSLLGAPLDERAAIAPMFLMEQMELREQLAEARKSADPFAVIEKIRTIVEARERALQVELATLLAQADPDSLKAAGDRVRKLQFLDKLLDEANNLEEDLVHAH